MGTLEPRRLPTLPRHDGLPLRALMKSPRETPRAFHVYGKDSYGMGTLWHNGGEILSLGFREN